MSRVASLIGNIGKSGMRLGPLDAVFAGVDYAGGKADGEDDIRAAAGAAGSVAGGWGGAMGGAAAGAALGSVVPVVGTAIGAGIGAIAGGMGGSFLGGWGADRADQVVRGNQGASTLEKQSYSESEQDRNSDVVEAAALGGAALGAYKLGGKAMMGGYNPVRAAGYNVGDAAGKFVRNPYVKAAGIIGAGTIANNMIGNPIGQGIDAVTGAMTGNRGTNLVSDNPSMSGRNTDIPDPYEKLVRQTGFANQRDAMDYQNQMGQQNAQLAYDRKFDYDDYMTRVKINADQASQLINSYNAGMQNATQAAAQVLNTRWI